MSILYYILSLCSYYIKIKFNILFNSSENKYLSAGISTVQILDSRILRLFILRMSAHMSLENTLRCTGIPTCTTLKQLHSSMSAHIICLVRLLFCAQAYPHSSHWNSFTPVWVCIWVVRLLFSVQAYPHSPHWNGFTPVHMSCEITPVCTSIPTFTTLKSASCC